MKAESTPSYIMTVLKNISQFRIHVNLLLPYLQADLGFFFATSLLLCATICTKMFENLLDYGQPQKCSLLKALMR